MKHKGISNTAAYIAIKFYGLNLDPRIRPLFSEDLVHYYENLVQYLPSSLSWYHKTLVKPFWRKLFISTEELLLPGDLMHIICRKYYLQKATENALAEGVKQVVILGSGFDHTGALFSKNGVRTFEIDTPVMIQEKKAFLTQNNLMSQDLHLCPLDVNKNTLSETLTEIREFDPNKKTLVLAEGFFDYIPLKSARNILKELNSLLPDMTLSSTFFSLNELNFFYRTSFTWGVAMVGEAIKLPLSLNGFLDLLSDTGYRTDAVQSYHDMQEDLIKSAGLELPVLKGFYILRAVNL
ncbi:class I SAM-dependent methyltransferase [Balneola sp. MJW-20]|uniref:class I SAM-dependent methyltransferase n=1 Tax=Gracilimonas aurantiaca TaxID=3234185 RepID=UPI0034664C53